MLSLKIGEALSRGSSGGSSGGGASSSGTGTGSASEAELRGGAGRREEAVIRHFTSPLNQIHQKTD